MTEPAVVRGTVAPALAEEWPGLAIAGVGVAGGPGPSWAGVRERLAGLSSRMSGAQAVALRQGEVAHAHRVFFRHVGLDPDVDRTPVEAAMLRRLLEGGFVAQERVADACLLAVAETGVGVWAYDAGDGDGGGLTLATAGDGRLLVADDRGPIAVLFTEVSADRVPTERTTHVGLFAVQVPGVADAYVHEALWIAAQAVTEA